MRKKTCIGVWAIVLVVFALTGTAMGAAKWLDSGYFNTPEKTFAWSDMIVYAEPNLQSKAVGQVKENRTNNGDVNLVQVRILWDGEKIHDIWARISSPVDGWVKWNGLGLADSGFIGEILYVPDDFEEVKP